MSGCQIFCGFMYPLKMNHQNFTLEGTLKKYELEPWDSGNIQHCTVSYNTSCNSDYNLTVLPNSDKYDVFYDLTIKQRTRKIPNLGRLRAKIHNSRGMGHCPKMVKISPEVHKNGV